MLSRMVTIRDSEVDEERQSPVRGAAYVAETTHRPNQGVVPLLTQLAPEAHHGIRHVLGAGICTEQLHEPVVGKYVALVEHHRGEQAVLGWFQVGGLPVNRHLLLNEVNLERAI